METFDPDITLELNAVQLFHVYDGTGTTNNNSETRIIRKPRITETQSSCTAKAELAGDSAGVGADSSIN